MTKGFHWLYRLGSVFVFGQCFYTSFTAFNEGQLRLSFYAGLAAVWVVVALAWYCLATEERIEIRN